MTTQISSKARSALDEMWMLGPARMAERLTAGRFKRYAHVQYLERKLAQALGRGGARLIITMPPRHGKSWLASLFTPAWYLSLWPHRHVILAAHDSTVAMLWGRSVRDFLKQNQSELAIQLAGNSASSSWNTAKGGGMVTAGFGGSIYGANGDLLIVDDPLKNCREAASESVRRRQIDWFNSTLRTHAEPNASIVVVMTRGHRDDLAGKLVAEGGWEHLRIPAIAGDSDVLGRSSGEALCNERYPRDVLEQVRTRLGSELWNTLYQQSPSATDGTMLKREWWRYYDELPSHFDEVVMSWDMTFKNTEASDFVVGQVWGRVGTHKFLIDQIRARMDFPATLKAVCDFTQKYPLANKKLIEDKANGSAILSILKDQVPGLKAVTPKTAKAERVAHIGWQVEVGNVYLPNSRHAPWIEEFVSECASFPNSKHDDQVDAMAYALTELR